MDRKFVAGLITVAEARIKDYKSMMDDLYKFKDNFSDCQWYRDHLRYMKNFEETRLKDIIKYQQFNF